MRISKAAAALLLIAGCSEAPRNASAPTALVEAEADQRRSAAEDGRILCARGNEAFARRCTVEQVQGADGLELTLRHDDGGFHRLRVTGDGRGVVAADGAQVAKVTVRSAGEIEVALGDARYRLPATVKPTR